MHRAAYKVCNRVFPYMTFHAVWMEGTPGPEPNGFETYGREIRELSKDEIFHLARTPGSGMDETHAESVERGDRCLALMDGEFAACLCWYARKGPVPLRGLWSVNFDDDCVYVHGAFTHPLHRGQRLLQCNLDAAFRQFSDQGRRRMVALVESHNYASLRAFRRAGYYHEGTIHTVRIGAESFIRHSANCADLGVRIAPRRRTVSSPREKRIVQAA
jgi:GNAT superfamily N-acetyltransferase